MLVEGSLRSPLRRARRRQLLPLAGFSFTCLSWDLVAELEWKRVLVELGWAGLG
jgi:hypothetical protein